MSIELDHTIVHARDPHPSATFLSEVLGRSAPIRFGPFLDVELDNHVTLAVDQISERTQAHELPYWGWPGASAGDHQPPTLRGASEAGTA